MAKRCPICDRELTKEEISDFCHFHGKYNPDNENLSKKFYRFLDNISYLEDLRLSIKYLNEHEKEYIEWLRKKGHVDAREDFKLRKERLIEILIESYIALMKIFLDIYVEDSGFLGNQKIKFYEKYSNIIQRRELEFQRTSPKYNPLKLLQLIRNIIIHPDKIKENKDQEEIVNIKHPKKFLKEEVCVQYFDDDSRNILLLHDLPKENKLERSIPIQPKVNRLMHPSIKLYIEYLRDEVIDTIRDIEKAQKNIL